MSNISDKNHFYKRICMTIGGIFLCGVSVGFLKLAVFGVDPFQSLMTGLNTMIPIPYGTLHIAVSICLLLFAFIFDRHYIGLGTIINLFLLGYIVDLSTTALQQIFIMPSLGIRIASFVFGIFLMCLSSSFYFTADMGVSPYDSVALILANKMRVGPFKYVRVCTDLICVTVGCGAHLLSGGPVSGISGIAGIGTIITAFFMGSLIDFFNRTIAQPFLEGRMFAHHYTVWHIIHPRSL